MPPRKKKLKDINDNVDMITADDIINIRLHMAEKHRLTLKDLYETDPNNVECEKLIKKISELENIDNALDAYNELKNNLNKLPIFNKIKTT